MSKVVQILVEGSTETEFVNNSLYPYLLDNGVSVVRPIGIETRPGHKGGDVRYARYKPNIINILRGREDMIVSSLIDFYKLREDFPKYDEVSNMTDPIRKVSFLEDACREDINDDRFIPYIQLHEFEGLLFTKVDGFQEIPDFSSSQGNKVEKIIRKFPNPELINEGDTTAPSKRILNIFPHYEKSLYGNFIALENKFETILEKCPRFKAWVDLLIERAK